MRRAGAYAGQGHAQGPEPVAGRGEARQSVGTSWRCSPQPRRADHGVEGRARLSMVAAAALEGREVEEEARF